MGLRPDYKYGWVWVDEPSTTAVPQEWQRQITSDKSTVQQGWVCPKCGRVNAPWLGTCPCHLNTLGTIDNPIVTWTVCQSTQG